MRPTHWLAFATITCLSAFLNLFQLQQNGFGNPYYTVAVESMSLHWHTFFFASFDPGGFVSVDKPPVGLWLQVLSIKLFGFSSLSLLMPQALEGVLAVALLFYLVRRHFGTLAATLAGLTLATTPVWVAMSRDNNLDVTLVLTLLLATWAINRAVETGYLRWLLLSMVLVGVGFNIKMLQAYLVLPALLLFYLLFARLTWRRRLLYLSGALIPLLLVSFAWVAAVDLTPSDQRPYVGSSQTNSELELALGYNGLGRLFQPNKGDPTKPATPRASHPSLALSQAWPWQIHNTAETTPPAKKALPPNPTGSPGLRRLFVGKLGTQASWLLLFAILGLPVLAWQRPWRRPQSAEVQALVFWGLWLLVVWSVLSISVHIQTYYTTMLAPALSVLTGVSMALLWRDYLRRPLRDWRGWMLPLFLPLAVIFQLTLLSEYPGWSSWLQPVLLTLVILSTLALIAFRLLRLLFHTWPRASRAALTCGLIALLFTPFTWSTVELTYPGNGGFPLAGPPAPTLQSTLNTFQHTQATISDKYRLTKNQQKLLDYLLAKRGKTPFLLSTLSTYDVIPFMLASGQAAMTLGGYNGTDPVFSLPRLVALIQQNSVRFFWLPFMYSLKHTGWIALGNTNAILENWIAGTCALISALSNPLPTHLRDRQVVYRLYDCALISGNA